MAETQTRTDIATLVEAERKVMAAYDLEYESRFLDLVEPRMRARVMEVGEGPPVLMVHGALAVASHWVPLMARLTGHRILAVDLPGYGLTDPYVYGRDNLREVGVGFLRSVIDALDLDSVPVVANSMGGLWTFWLTLDDPSRIETVTQVACPALLLGTSAPISFRMMGMRGLNRLLVRMLPTPDGKSQLRQLGETAAAETAPPEFLTLLEATADPDPFWPASFSLLQAATNLRGPRMRFTEAELSRVEHPTLFVWGENDPFGSPAVGEHAASIMPDARSVRVRAGHLPWVGQPEVVAEPIRQHLTRAHPNRR
jgi:2-hydroxy-6-oxonona-2,4-dienedioate hydrolase